MLNFTDMILPLALLAAPIGGSERGDNTAKLTPPPEETVREHKPQPISLSHWVRFTTFDTDVAVDQVRIERRVTIRIAPRSQSRRPDLMTIMPARPVAARYAERKMGKCIPVRSIGGVQASRDNKLLFFMKDRRVISASLPKSCLAREFYSGLYVERSDDGMLCVSRDLLQSRAGTSCEVKRLRQLVVSDK